MTAVASASRLDRATDALERIAEFARNVRAFDAVSLTTALCALDDIATLGKRVSEECKGTNNV